MLPLDRNIGPLMLNNNGRELVFTHTNLAKSIEEITTLCIAFAFLHILMDHATQHTLLSILTQMNVMVPVVHNQCTHHKIYRTETHKNELEREGTLCDIEILK